MHQVGATAVVPGSHKLCRGPEPRESDPEENPKAVAIEAPAGSLMVWHGNTLHGPFRRTSPGLRIQVPVYMARPLLTACWATDAYTQEGGSTMIVPGSHTLKRHPNEVETVECAGAVPIECDPGSVAMWDGSLWHSNYPRSIDGERVVCHITYTRMMMRPVEDYAAHAQGLIKAQGERMAQLLGRDDFLMGPDGADYSKLIQSFNNAKR